MIFLMFPTELISYTQLSKCTPNSCNVTCCFRMCQESAEDGSFRRLQLDTALKALYTSSESLSHTVEGDREEGGTRGDAMDTAEPSAHAQVRIRYVIHVILQLHCFLPVIVSAHHIHVTFSHLLTSPLSFLSHLIISRSKTKVQSARTLGNTVMVSVASCLGTRLGGWWEHVMYTCTCIMYFGLHKGEWCFVKCAMWFHTHLQLLLLHVANYLYTRSDLTWLMSLLP